MKLANTGFNFLFHESLQKLKIVIALIFLGKIEILTVYFYCLTVFSKLNLVKRVIHKEKIYGLNKSFYKT